MTSDDVIRVVLADDEHLLRSALATLLPSDGTIEIVAEAADGAAAVAAALRLTPDVVVIDLEMPEMDGLEAVTRIKEQMPDQPVLMLTRHTRPGVLRRALGLGVRGFLSKNAEPEEIADVIREIAAGGRWIGRDVLEISVVDDSPLTDRERDVLQAAYGGHSVKEIARRLHLAPGTVRNYLSSAMQKTGSSTRYRAAHLAAERGWL
ncbi:two-component system response regulator DesR [Microbacterium foliorum]|uniref:Two-component system response regulator DesR n=1 Tax=Microbacterium foliorum TaxID=104336 RepID=A0ABU1HVH0_9MICO|nr:response regulator transcription factor [Microbacterium foliorum]MDR6144052.1 two-component system response regulator DesR [Microbacterium foliorum]